MGSLQQIVGQFVPHIPYSTTIKPNPHEAHLTGELTTTPRPESVYSIDKEPYLTGGNKQNDIFDQKNRAQTKAAEHKKAAQEAHERGDLLSKFRELRHGLPWNIKLQRLNIGMDQTGEVVEKPKSFYLGKLGNPEIPEVTIAEQIAKASRPPSVYSVLEKKINHTSTDQELIDEFDKAQKKITTHSESANTSSDPTQKASSFSKAASWAIKALSIQGRAKDRLENQAEAESSKSQPKKKFDIRHPFN